MYMNKIDGDQKVILVAILWMIDYIIDSVDCEIGLESTVIDMTASVPVILRPGAITLEMLQVYLPNVILDPGLLQESAKAKCPGMKYKHYSPKAEVEIVCGEKSKIRDYISSRLEVESNCGVMTYGGGDYDNAVCVLAAGNTMEEYASKLFYNLRVFDEYGVNKVYAEFNDEAGIGVAVKNRLFKAAGNTVTKV